MTIKLIIFDLDGTHIDSLKDITIAVNYATRPYGIAEKSISEMGDLLGTGISILIDRVLADRRDELKEVVLERFMDYYSGHLVECTTVYPGVKDLLGNLDRYKKAVVTNKREQFAKTMLNELGLGSYFDSILGSDSVGAKKPSPVPLLHLLESGLSLTGREIEVGKLVDPGKEKSRRRFLVLLATLTVLV